MRRRNSPADCQCARAARRGCSKVFPEFPFSVHQQVNDHGGKREKPCPRMTQDFGRSLGEEIVPAALRNPIDQHASHGYGQGDEAEFCLPQENGQQEKPGCEKEGQRGNPGGDAVEIGIGHISPILHT